MQSLIQFRKLEVLPTPAGNQGGCLDLCFSSSKCWSWSLSSIISSHSMKAWLDSYSWLSRIRARVSRDNSLARLCSEKTRNIVRRNRKYSKAVYNNLRRRRLCEPQCDTILPGTSLFNHPGIIIDNIDRAQQQSNTTFVNFNVFFVAPEGVIIHTQN